MLDSNITEFSTGFNVSNFKYLSALIKMTHDFDLTDCQFASAAETLSKRRRRKMGAKTM